MSVTFRIDLSDEAIEELPGNDLSIMLEYLSSSVARCKEDVYNTKFGKYRVFTEREGENLWTIYRIEEDESTTKV